MNHLYMNFLYPVRMCCTWSTDCHISFLNQFIFPQGCKSYHFHPIYMCLIYRIYNIPGVSACTYR